MPFYKRDNKDLISTDFLEGPGIMLSEASKDEHTYPVEGWYWFADLDAAMQGMLTGAEGAITPRQARLALAQAGLLDSVNTAVAAQQPSTQIEWEYSVAVHRDNPLLLQITEALGMTAAQVDELFTLARTL